MEKEAQQISEVLDQQGRNLQSGVPGNFDYYRNQLTDEQYQAIYDSYVQRLKAHWFSAYGELSADQYFTAEKNFNDQLIVDESELVPAMKRLVQKIEGDAYKKEYAKLVYAHEDKEFQPIRYNMKQMQLYLEYYWIRQGKEFKVTPEYFKVYRQLCLYFCDDERFEGDLNKGLWLYGCVGDGKTSVMKAFALNQKLSYRVVSVPDIAEEYQENGSVALKQYCENLKRPRNPFGQTELSLCLDDVGTETVNKHYGDPLNVVERIILKRYSAGLITHFTTNLNTAAIKEMYGDRAASRLRELVNIIQLPETDLRS